MVVPTNWPSYSLEFCWGINGGFHKWWYPKMDGLWWKMSNQKGWFGGTPILGNLQVNASTCNPNGPLNIFESCQPVTDLRPSGSSLHLRPNISTEQQSGEEHIASRLHLGKRYLVVHEMAEQTLAVAVVSLGGCSNHGTADTNNTTWLVYMSWPTWPVWKSYWSHFLTMSCSDSQIVQGYFCSIIESKRVCNLKRIQRVLKKWYPTRPIDPYLVGGFNPSEKY